LLLLYSRKEFLKNSPWSGDTEAWDSLCRDKLAKEKSLLHRKGNNITKNGANLPWTL
jgi:predicted dithiol-disulfide oxidoreductase (DUF899 family)